MNLWSLILFFPIFVLLFILLYQACKRNFIEHIASICVSLIFGTIVGYWIGGLIGFVFSGYPIVPSIFLFGSLLSQFAACSAAYVATQWRSPVSKTGMVNERLVGVVLIAALYVILGLLLSALASLLFLVSYTVSLEAILLKPLILVGLILLLVIASAISFLIAYGFYASKRWAWLVIFASALIGIFSSINQIIFGFSLGIWLTVKILMLLISTFIFIYLLQPHIRIYFGIVNSSQENISEVNN